MVKHALVLALLVAMSSLAYAECELLLADADPTPSRLGTRIGGGRIPVAGQPITTMSLGIGFDHFLHGRWRVVAEYEFLWLGHRDRPYWDAGVAGTTHTGHRVHGGLRRTLAAKTQSNGHVRFLVDGEAGGGVALVGDMTGTIALPHAYVGARLGLDLLSNRSRASGLWEYEIVLRALAMRDGVGGMFGIGMVWGD